MYNTIASADAYVTSHYRSGSAACARWAALSNDDKSVLLTNAFEAIEALPFRGRKAVSGQEAAFPRLPFQYGSSETGAPQNVQHAETELALWMSDDGKRQSSEKREQLIADGVKSLSIGDLSESYNDTSGKESVSVALSCKKAMSLLQPYLSGGYEIC